MSMLVEHSDDHDLLLLRCEVHRIGELVKQGAPEPEIDLGKMEGVFGEAL